MVADAGCLNADPDFCDACLLLGDARYCSRWMGIDAVVRRKLVVRFDQPDDWFKYRLLPFIYRLSGPQFGQLLVRSLCTLTV